MPDQRPLRVLIVDDDITMQRSLARSLAAQLAITLVSSGHEAVLLIGAGRRFDVIVSDMWMPGIDGQRLHEEISAIATDQASRILFVTGGGLPARMRAFLRDQVVVEKPVQLDQLVASIRRIAERPARSVGAREAR